ncbi:MAG: hypothetical protein JNK72_02510 [Myxococcales bacterium]|nr:hypothetical protein [Myxococcales bacterium]
MSAEPPPKKQQLHKLLDRGSVFVHLDPRREGVKVPEWLAARHQLVLQLGLNFAIPIPDLVIDEEGVRCTLSFNRSPFLCVLPWSAVYALVAEDGQVTVWPRELPPEMVPEPAAVRRSPPASRGEKTKSSRPKIAAVPPVDEAPRAETPAGDEKVSTRGAPKSRKERTPRSPDAAAARADKGAKPSAEASSEAPAPEAAEAPASKPRLAEVRQLRTSQPPPAPEPERATAEPEREPEREPDPPRPSSPPPSGRKARELPSYLRVVK